jgi:hypothetical protein
MSVYLFERAKSYDVGLGGQPAPAVRVALKLVTAAEKSLLHSQPHTPSTSIPCSPTLIREMKGKTRVRTREIDRGEETTIRGGKANLSEPQSCLIGTEELALDARGQQLYAGLPASPAPPRAALRMASQGRLPAPRAAPSRAALWSADLEEAVEALVATATGGGGTSFTHSLTPHPPPFPAAPPSYGR